MSQWDLIVAGAGPAGMMAAITAARRRARVLVIEQRSHPGAKLRASGGGRCNITNTLDTATFIGRFGREGRFMKPALEAFDHRALIAFLAEIGVQTHAPDGFRVFPVTHDAATVTSALEAELARLGVEVATERRVKRLRFANGRVEGLETPDHFYSSNYIIIATGGMGYPSLGGSGDGYGFARSTGHTVTDVFPAMLPLKTKETWVKNCRADTIGKAELRIDLPKAKHARAVGDLIFTNEGIRGPVVLDLAREITPLLARHGEVPLLANLTKGRNEEEIRIHLRKYASEHAQLRIGELVATLVPAPLSRELCLLAGIDPFLAPCRVPPSLRDRLIKLLAWTPLTVTGHGGFEQAMATRGGVSLKEIRPETLESRLVKGLFFCGEVLNLDGPCGGFNLQWAFSSGFLAGHLGGSSPE
ncbi:MAG TPA: NAD(P)/FAD-dependent oxidoreductase [Candidatus Ozemobacteraceae bacterium]|nr:NAD(P)/FAD-dependent oxidoreductase [Candidatus Ozemobacteraceae bacterium]